jgi:hypothetical protein
MSIRGTGLLLHLSTAVPAGLAERFEGVAAQEFVAALHEDLLDMASTWRRVGRERHVVVLLDCDEDAAMRRIARRGLTAEVGYVQKSQLVERVIKALSSHRTVAVLDQPPPDFALVDIDRLLRRAGEGLAFSADLDGDWAAFALANTAVQVLSAGADLASFVAEARLADVALHPMTPLGRIDSESELLALGLRIRERRARAPRMRRLVFDQGLLEKPES